MINIIDNQNTIIIKDLGLSPYEITWQMMKDFTQKRTPLCTDEFWIVQHPSVFTQGQAGKPEHLLDPKDIPVIQSDRGGQATYHGPGQLVVYTLLNIHRKNLTIKRLVNSLENALIALLSQYGIEGVTRCAAPGVYVKEAKIASIGLRIRRGCSYHGLSLNVSMDLEPFSRINPCGYFGLKVIQMSDLISNVSFPEVKHQLIDHLAHNLGYTNINWR